MEPHKILTVDPEQGEKLLIAGGEYRILISGKQTGGAYAVIEISVPPGGGPNPHSHPHIHESFNVLKGEITFKSELGSYVATEKSFVNIPKGGMIHAFKNLSDKRAKLLCTVIPAGLDDFFHEVSAFVNGANDTTLSVAEIKRNLSLIAEKYGQQLYSENFLG